MRGRTLEELDYLLQRVGKDPKIRALIITGQGTRAFSSGGDIEEIEKMSPSDALSFAELAHKVLRKIESTEKPIISAVNGLALGAGCDLANACDVSVASKTSKFGMPSLRIGVITPFGGMSRLPRTLGRSMAMYLFSTGALLDSTTALNLGIVQQVCEDEEIQGEAMKLAQKILEMSPVAFGWTKRLLYEGSRRELAKIDRLEIEYYSRCFEAEDRREGARAFLEKRPAEFKRT